mmetsp:Transcript_30734/g.67045  ORF Transcript_30734/g.67045 Transcript_30734/m.67045 type:complete len:101 (+) Transcript_30734:945-1247(+)|eukprot:CAMPEP_0116892190 /NCGR_PEP_ID=MMETSP0467-20121206/2467_1 /TAXON_ID=283647 /ORGANISM="Mesodinium pulex, Strain SPMC105" /LENGTH=100 /DNA_ID=CAMNT_0004561179 /DNA_START=605 /DNA_END=907 /DNA_ORIENTATION=-
MKVSLLVAIPDLDYDHHFDEIRDILTKYNLEVLNIKNEVIYEVGNKYMIGFSEVEIFEMLEDAVYELSQLSKRVLGIEESNENIKDKDKKSKGEEGGNEE